jgi:hypothetical protein
VGSNTSKRRWRGEAFGEALCKRLKGTREGLLVALDRSHTGEGGLHRRRFLDHLGVSLLPAPYIGIPAQPQKLPIVDSTKDSQSVVVAPVPAKKPVWDIDNEVMVVYEQKAADAHVPARIAGANMGYAEYVMWLDKVLPEGTGPTTRQKTLEPSDAHVLSTLDLLQRFPQPKAGAEVEFPALKLKLKDLAAPPKKGPPPLSDRELAIALDCLDEGGDPKEVLVNKFSVEVTRRDMACLRPGQWLNDEVINFFLKLLQERSNSQPSIPKCWFPNTHFWPKLGGPDGTSYNFQEVKRWTTRAKVDIFALDKVVFPVHVGHNHWALGLIDMKAQGFRYLDSLSCRPHPNLEKFLQKYLQDEHLDKKEKPLEGVVEWKILPIEEPVPQQENDYDCGVFMCSCAEAISAGRSLDYCQDDMPNIRKRLAAQIKTASFDVS